MMRSVLEAFFAVMILGGCSSLKTIVEGVREIEKAAQETAPDAEELLEKAIEQ